MSSKAEIRTSAKPTVATPLPDDIAALFASTRQATAEELAALEKAADALRKDPRFLADFSKGLAREEILRSMEEAGLNKVAYAAQS